MPEKFFKSSASRWYAGCRVLAAEGDGSGQAAEHPQPGTVAGCLCGHRSRRLPGRVAPPPVLRWSPRFRAGKPAGTAESRRACLSDLWTEVQGNVTAPHPDDEINWLGLVSLVQWLQLWCPLSNKWALRAKCFDNFSYIISTVKLL